MPSIVDYARNILQQGTDYGTQTGQPARSPASYPQARSETGELPLAGGFRGGAGVLPAQDQGGPAEAPLEGLPTRVKIPATGQYVEAGPDPRVRQIARQYMEEAGLPYNPPTKYARVDPERSKRIADAYEAMPHEPDHPLVQAAYQQMAKEVMDQYAVAKRAGFKAEFWDPETEEDPYGASPRLAIEDIRNNHHMYVFPTFSGYGQEQITEEDLRQNPLLADSGERWNGKPVTINDIFRAIHDYYGHAKEGVGFRADGEENAWRAHASMFSPLARLAMTAETRGQNSWVNYGPQGDKNRTASGADTVFAEQKIGLVPHWVLHEGAEDFIDPAEMEQLRALYERHGKARGGEVEERFIPHGHPEREENKARFLEGNHPEVPHVVYHGAPDVRPIFKEGFKPQSRGDVHFGTDSYPKADSYADAKRAWDYQNAEPHVIPLHISLKNPMVIDAKGAHWRETEKYVKAAKDAGHDGLIIKNSVDYYNNSGKSQKPGNVYAWFSPTQAKSALDSQLKSRVDGTMIENAMPNRGTFDPNDPDITKAEGGSVIPHGHPEREENLADWNKGNKLVDEQGNPLTLYRGAVGHKELPEGFLQGKTRGNYATFTSTSPYLASTYANPNHFFDPHEAGGVMPIHVHAHVLHEFPTKGPYFDMFAFDDFARKLPKGHAVVARQVSDPGPRAYSTADPESKYQRPSDIYAWNEANSVKSAIGNRGTFDPESPDITKATGGEVDDRDFSPVPGVEAYHEDPDFKEWFGNSATHRDGVPVTYYTGTSKDTDFNKFNVGRHGAWFTADPFRASEYAFENDSQDYKYERGRYVRTNTASRVIPAHLKIENPYTGPMPPEFHKDNYKAAQSQFFDILRAKGYDGWIPAVQGGKLAVVLKEPHQIKTVYNRTWDPKNPRMDKAGGGEVDNPAPEINNPVSVFPKPQRMFGEDEFVPGGKYLNAATKEDMTGHKSAAASIGVNPGGRPYFKASADAVDETGTPGRGSAIAKTNLFKQKAGWKWLAAPEGHEETGTIVSVEHRGDHHYALHAHFPKGVDLARYENSPSEPRLRPTTRGNLSFGPQVGSISVRGKEHPVYDHVIVKANGGAVGNEEEGITAYHGSPHDFDEFDLSKIGTGEGNQVYGHGLYFAEHPAVARGYRDSMTKNDGSILIGSKPFAALYDETMRRADRLPPEAAQSLYDRLSILDDLSIGGDILHVRENAKQGAYDPAAVEWFEKEVAPNFNRQGRLYEVRINAHPDHFLDWDKPLSEQSEHVRKALTSLAKGDDALMDRIMAVHKNGSKADIAYGSLTEHFVRNKKYEQMRSGMPEKEATPSLEYGQRLTSDALASVGIKGIRYLDAGSRGAGEGSRNYVVFDDKLVNVKRKYADGGVVEENDHGEEKHQARAAGGKAAGQRSGWASSVKISERSPVVDRALMVVSRKA